MALHTNIVRMTLRKAYNFYLNIHKIVQRAPVVQSNLKTQYLLEVIRKTLSHLSQRLDQIH